MSATDRILVSRGEALDLLRRCAHRGVRILCVETCLVEDGRPVPDSGEYAEFSDTFGGEYTDADAAGDAEMFVSEQPEGTMLLLGFPSGAVARLRSS